jgi:hypothetical protein
MSMTKHNLAIKAAKVVGLTQRDVAKTAQMIPGGIVDEI